MSPTSLSFTDLTNIGQKNWITRMWADDPNDSFTDGQTVSATNNGGTGGANKAMQQATAGNRPYYRESRNELGGRSTFDGIEQRFFNSIDGGDTFLSGDVVTGVNVRAIPEGDVWEWPIAEATLYNHCSLGDLHFDRIATATSQWTSFRGSNAAASADRKAASVVITRFNTTTGELRHRINGIEASITGTTGALSTVNARCMGNGAGSSVEVLCPFYGIADIWLPDADVALIEEELAAYYAITLATPKIWWGYTSPSALPNKNKYGISIEYDAANAVVDPGVSVDLANTGNGTRRNNDASTFDLAQTTVARLPSVVSRHGRQALFFNGAESLTTNTVDGGAGGEAEDIIPATDSATSGYAVFECLNIDFSQANIVISLGSDANRLYIGVTNTPRIAVTQSGTLVENNLPYTPDTYIASWSIDGAGNGLFYLNGVEQNDKIISTGVKPTTGHFIGIGADGVGTGFYFYGYIWATAIARERDWTASEHKAIQSELASRYNFGFSGNVATTSHHLTAKGLTSFGF